MQNTPIFSKRIFAELEIDPKQPYIEITTVGPQGPAAAGFTFNGDNKVNDSIVYYDSTSDTFKADATTTKLTLVDGGNF